MTDGSVRLDANDRAAGAVLKQAGISWPMPVDRRLDQLVEMANSIGAGTRRNELAAAILLAAASEPDQLLRSVLAWRTTRIRDVLIDVDTVAVVVELPRHRPGRRRQQS